MSVDKLKVRLLAMHDPIIHSCLMMGEVHGLPWPEVLERMVVALAEDRKITTAHLLTYVRRYGNITEGEAKERAAFEARIRAEAEADAIDIDWGG